MRLISIAAGVSVVALALTGCTGGGSSGGDLVDGATFTLGLSTDPGSLDPHSTAGSALLQATMLSYDTLVSIDAKGTISGQLATEWAVTEDTVSLTLKDDITCSDGTPFTAKDAAANLAWVGDIKNESPFLGVFLPVGAEATATTDTELVIKLPAPSPFVLNGLASLPMVCGNVVDDRASLASETHGTGPYVLTKAAPGDHYDYTLRDDYTWGPNGVTSKTEGLPAKVVVKIVTNETTAANLLLSGELNSATVSGSDAARLQAAKLFVSETAAIGGEMWLNHTAERAMSDKNVRLAFTKAVDLNQIAKVATSDKGTPATTFAVAEPVACTGDSVSGALPSFDVKAAEKLLDEAGWKKGSDGVRTKDGKPLAVTFVQDAGGGAAGAGAAELATKAWTDLGAQVTSKAQEESVLIETVFGTGDWDIAWLPLNISTPDGLVPFASGPAPAEGGSNFGHVDNADYLASVAKASAQPGTDGCADWLDAESALVRDADIVPFANITGLTFGSKASFETSGQIIPSSIRMTSK